MKVEDFIESINDLAEIECVSQEVQTLLRIIFKYRKALNKIKKTSCCNICDCGACIAKEALNLKVEDL